MPAWQEAATTVDMLRHMQASRTEADHRNRCIMASKPLATSKQTRAGKAKCNPVAMTQKEKHEAQPIHFFVWSHNRLLNWREFEG